MKDISTSWDILNGGVVTDSDEIADALGELNEEGYDMSSVGPGHWPLINDYANEQSRKQALRAQIDEENGW